MVRKKYFPIFFLLLYLLFIFYITLYTRSFSLTQSCNPDFFWSYAAWAQGKPGYGKEILLNIALFVPLDFALPDNKTPGSGLTIIVGPNNSGKTTIIESIQAFNGYETGYRLQNISNSEFC